ATPISSTSEETRCYSSRCTGNCKQPRIVRSPSLTCFSSPLSKNWQGIWPRRQRRGRGQSLLLLAVGTRVRAAPAKRPETPGEGIRAADAARTKHRDYRCGRKIPGRAKRREILAEPIERRRIDPSIQRRGVASRQRVGCNFRGGQRRCGTRRSLRRRFLWHSPARSGAHGSPAPDFSRVLLGSTGGRRVLARKRERSRRVRRL